jgi:hypothetical protein
MTKTMAPAVLAAWTCLTAPAAAQPGRPPEPAVLLAAQREAMKPLAWTFGRWQGEAWSVTDGKRHDVIQTERIGPMLDGTIVVMEGKSFERDGKPSAFNAFGVMSYDAQAKSYALHSHAQGRAGTFPLEVTPNGYAWQIQAGPMKIRYVATFKDGVWREAGEMIRPDGRSTPIFEMNLKRVGDTDWPLAGQANGPAALR